VVAAVEKITNMVSTIKIASIVHKNIYNNDNNNIIISNEIKDRLIYTFCENCFTWSPSPEV
jgi:hypothetical protein